MKIKKIRQSVALCGGLLGVPVLGVLASCGLAVGDAQSATVYFSDGFESQTDPLGAPPVGAAWFDSGLGDNHALAAGVGFGGSQALEVIRDNAGTAIPSLTGAGTAGGLVAGNVIEYVFHINQVESPEGTTHNFNAPIQNKIGFANGQALINFGTLSGGSENYFVTNSGVNVDLGVTIPRNTAAYDALRFVLTLTEPAVGQLGGTYEVFLDVDDADGIATTSRGVFNLTTQVIPVANSTNASFQISRGGFTSTSLYDDISISQVPEPGSVAVAMVGGLLMIVRRRSA